VNSGLNSDLIRERLTKSVVEARAGSPLAAVEVAAIVHRFPELAKERGLSTEYDYFLSLAERSEDPELLTSIGEALCQGKLLARNGRLAVRYFARADKFSPFMGAFMLGRLEGVANSKVSRQMINKAARAGHVPSAIFRTHRMMSQLGPLKWLYLPVFALMVSIRISLALRNREGLYLRLWRYRDVLPSKNDLLRKKYLPIDRADPFHDIRELVGC